MNNELYKNSEAIKNEASKSVNFILKESLTCFQATFTLADYSVSNITVQSESEFLSEILKFEGCCEYWIEYRKKIIKTKIENNSGFVLKVLEVNQFKLKERNIENTIDRKYYEVLIDGKEIGSYFITDDLIDVHHIEHFCGIFKCLGYRTEITIEN